MIPNQVSIYLPGGACGITLTAQGLEKVGPAVKPPTAVRGLAFSFVPST